MKPSGNPAFVNFILSNQRMLIAELYTFTLLDGSNIYFTSLDMDLNVDGNTYVANSLRIEGLKYKVAVGLQVDEQDIKISAYPEDTLGGAQFFAAVQEGLLDGAYLSRRRGFWAVSTGISYRDYALPPVGVVELFIGRVATISKIGRTHVEMKLKSPLSLLDIEMPRNTYQPGCQYTLFDQGCGLLKASFTFSGVVFGVVDADLGITVTGGIPSPIGADGIPTYSFGRLLFTSGSNNDLQVSIAANDSSIMGFQYPPIKNIQPGDTFDAWPGCSKTDNTCDLKFSNKIHFRGFPRVPPIVVSA